MAMLGNATVVSARTGRKLNNALTLTFKTSADRHGVLRSGDGAEVGRVVAYPKESRADSAWPHQLTDAAGQALGVLTWVRTTGKIDVIGELTDLYIWWDRAGQALKVPSLGAHLALNHAVADVLGDLVAACVDMTVGSHSFITV